MSNDKRRKRKKKEDDKDEYTLYDANNDADDLYKQRLVQKHTENEPDYIG